LIRARTGKRGARGSHLRAAAFALGKYFGRVPRTEAREIQLDLDGRRVPADVYRRVGARATAGTILFVHGATVYAHRDPRIVDVCRHLTVSGCAIVAPRYDELAAFSMDRSTIERIEQTIASIVRHPDLAPPGDRVGVFSTSISAGYCLVAARRPRTAPLVGALCLMGGLYSPDGLERLFLADEHPFARDLVLLNFLHLATGARPGVERALRAALEDDSFSRTMPELPRVLETLEAEDRALFARVRTDRELRLSSLEQIRPALAELMAEASELGTLTAPVVLVHGENDPIAPPSESRRLFEALERSGADARLDVTPLLGHMETVRLGPELVPAIARLVGSFARFFREVTA
jgi:pimeloyl-ACP methyl ester carboxylesterase